MSDPQSPGARLRERVEAAIRWVDEWLPNRMDDEYTYERTDVLKVLREAADALRASSASEGAPADSRLIQDMRRASALVDEASDPTDYSARLVALALIARQFLRVAAPAVSPAPPEKESR